MNGAVQEMIDLLQMEQIEENLFRAQNGPGNHVFGGQVLGQAIVAASKTVGDRHLHSIHAYFLRRGDPKRPILFDVDRIRDGRSFTTRRVVGIQHGRAIFNMSSSFQVEGIQMLPRGDRPATEPRKNTWLRCRESLPEDRIVHLSFLAYMSDLDFMAVSMQPHGPSMKGYRIQGASLDHALWFHRPFRADEWLLFSKESPTAARARGFVRGHVFNRDGELVASASQECLIRLREREHSVAG